MANGTESAVKRRGGNGTEAPPSAGHNQDVLARAYREMLLIRRFEEKAGQLYGDTAEEAYDVDVSDAVNTPATISAGRLLARASYVPGPFAERVEITLLALPIPAATAV